jgi:glutathione S-transferase
MKLFYTPLRDVVHKVQVVALETGTYDRMERIPTDPYKREPAHVAANPLSRVPTLVTDDGQRIFGGPAIYEYLDTLNEGPKLFPPPGPARWDALRQMTLGDTIFDVAALRQNELKRPRELQSDAVMTNWLATIGRALEALDQEASTFQGITVGLISVACGLMYLDKLRNQGSLPIDWRQGHGRLDAWYTEFTKRPSFRPRDNAIAMR